MRTRCEHNMARSTTHSGRLIGNNITLHSVLFLTKSPITVVTSSAKMFESLWHRNLTALPCSNWHLSVAVASTANNNDPVDSGWSWC